MTILLATRNQGKLREFQQLLPGVELVPWPAAGPELPEEGAFFQDNALQKATCAREWWSRHGDVPISGVLADDSGLCVDALWGGPGVLSARFAKDLAQDAKNRLLLTMLPEGQPRTARFVCILAWAPAGGGWRVFPGVVEGSLAPAPRGSLGFGFDPIFIPQGLERTFGELAAEAKHQLSHRSRACEAFKAAILGQP